MLLQVRQHLDHLLGVGARQAAPLLQNCLQLAMRQLVKVQLDKPVPKGLGQHLATAVLARRILRAEQSEARTRRDGCLRLGNVQLPVVVQNPVERLEHICRRQVELVKNDPGALQHGFHQHTVFENQLTVGVRGVGADVLLNSKGVF